MGHDQPHNDFYAMMLSSFASVAELLRTTELKVYDNVGKLFAVITGNDVLLARFHRTPYVTSEFSTEIAAFVDNRINLLLKSCVEGVKRHLNYDPETSVKTINIGDMTINDTVTFLENDLRYLEFEALNIARRASAHFSDIDPSISLVSTMNYDLKAMLEVLIAIFDRHSNQLSSSSGSKHRTLSSQDRRIKELIVLSYIISKLAIALEYASNDCNVFAHVTDRRKQLVFTDHQKYSTIGSLPLDGIVCCFKNIKLLPTAVTNPKGRISLLDDRGLLDILTLSVLT